MPAPGMRGIRRPAGVLRRSRHSSSRIGIPRYRLLFARIQIAAFISAGPLFRLFAAFQIRVSGQVGRRSQQFTPGCYLLHYSARAAAAPGLRNSRNATAFVLLPARHQSGSGPSQHRPFYHIHSFRSQAGPPSGASPPSFAGPSLFPLPPQLYVYSG